MMNAFCVQYLKLREETENLRRHFQAAHRPGSLAPDSYAATSSAAACPLSQSLLKSRRGSDFDHSSPQNDTDEDFEEFDYGHGLTVKRRRLSPPQQSQKFMPITMHRERAKIAVVVKTSGRKSVPPSDSAASAAAKHASVQSGTGSGPTSSSATSSVPDSSAFVKRVAMRRATGPKATRSSPQKASAVVPSGALGEDVGDAASDDDDQPADRGDTPARAVSPVRSTRSSQAEADDSGVDRNGEDLPSPRARGRPAFNEGQLYLPSVSSASSSQRPGRKRVRGSYSSGDEEELTEHEEHDKDEVSTSSPLFSMDHADRTRVMLGLTLAIKSPEETILSLDSPFDNDEDNDEDENDHEPALALFGTTAFVLANVGAASQANVGAAPPTTVGQVLALEALALPTLKRARMATGHDECLAQTRESYTAMTGVRLSPSVPHTQEEAEDSYIVWRNEKNQRNPELGYCNSDWKVLEILVRMTKSECYYRRVKSEPTDAEQIDDESMDVDNDEDNPSAPVSTRLTYTPSRADVTHTSASASNKRPVAARASKKDASRYNALRVVRSPGKM
ncbi:hypothetical protein OC835_006721 [Tilletia horrida]|nr:hypothetical protein OC835_006721 [Tilletia horrida]